MHITKAPNYLYIRVVIIAPAYASLCETGNANNLLQQLLTEIQLTLTREQVV